VAPTMTLSLQISQAGDAVQAFNAGCQSAADCMGGSRANRINYVVVSDGELVPEGGSLEYNPGVIGAPIPTPIPQVVRAPSANPPVNAAPNPPPPPPRSTPCANGG
jgi:hypothetical protein